MKYNTWAPIILLVTNFCAKAQTTEMIRVNAGDDVATAVSSYGIYRFPSFTSGSILLKDGREGTELLNYNILYGRIMYIDRTKGDTLAIGIPDQIKQVTINCIHFYYDNKDCEEEIAGASTASLLVKRKISIDYQKKGAFGIASTAAGGIDAYTTLPGLRYYHLSVNEDAIIKKQVSYFLLTSEGLQLPATKSNFISLFPKNKGNIESYLKNNKVNFNKEQDLTQLLGIAATGN